MKLALGALRDRLRSSLWFVPGLAVLAICAVAVVTLRLDDRGTSSLSWLAFDGSPESARSVLTAIAASIITLTALVFSVTVVALQLASSQFSPRVLRSFLRDRPSQAVLAVFLATFVYTMLVLRAVRDADGPREPFVPQMSVHIAFALTALSVALFVYYVHHIAQSMQASTIVARVTDETAQAIERLYADRGGDERDAPAPEGAAEVVTSTARSGYLQAVDQDRLFLLAVEHDLVVRLRPRVGDFVPTSAVLFEVDGDLSPGVARRIASAVTLGRQRTMQQDAAFGFRQLVDIAEKALSPGVNDPTTAVQALDRLYELLLLLGPRRIASPHTLRQDGRVRVVIPRPTWDSYVHLAFDEIRQYGEGSIQISRRIAAIVDDLLEIVPEARRPALERQRDLAARGAERAFDDAEDVRHARRGSRHG